MTGEVGKGNFENETLKASLERRDQHIGRLNERLGAANEVIRIARSMSDAIGSPRTGHDAPVTLEGFLLIMRRHQAALDIALALVDEIEKRNRNTLDRLQGKRADRVPK